MSEDCFDIGVIVTKRKLKGPWESHAWLPTSALPAVPAAAPWTRLTADENAETFYAGSYEVILHDSATSHYRDNLMSGNPSLWVSLRHQGGDDYELAAVTADPYEGEALAGAIGEIVEPVPMPLEIQARVAAFFDAFHKERVFIKRKRDRADPNALANRPHGSAGFKKDRS